MNSPKATRASKRNSSKSDESASNTSPHSVRSCNVVLSRTDLSNYENEKIAHNTRGRKSSHLTADNVAALTPTESKRSSRSKSVASDETATTATTATTSTSVTRRASSRLAAAPKTPLKEAATRSVSTPSRRNSRLVSESEAPISSPAKRTRLPKSITAEEVMSPNKRSTRTRSVQKSPEPVRATESEPGTPSRRRTAATRARSVQKSPEPVRATESEPGTPSRRRTAATRARSVQLSPEPESELGTPSRRRTAATRARSAQKSPEPESELGTPSRRRSAYKSTSAKQKSLITEAIKEEEDVPESAINVETEPMVIDDSDNDSVISIASTNMSDVYGTVSAASDLPVVIEVEDDIISESSQSGQGSNATETAVGLVCVDTESTISASNDIESEICDLTHDSQEAIVLAKSSTRLSEDSNLMHVDDQQEKSQFANETTQDGTSTVLADLINDSDMFDESGSNAMHATNVNENDSATIPLLLEQESVMPKQKEQSAEEPSSLVSNNKRKSLKVDSAIDENIDISNTPPMKLVSKSPTLLKNMINTPDQLSSLDESFKLKNKIDKIFADLSTPVTSKNTADSAVKTPTGKTIAHKTPRNTPAKTSKQPENTPVKEAAGGDEQSNSIVLPATGENMVCNDSQLDTKSSTPSTRNVQRRKTPTNTPAKMPEQLEIAAAEEMEASENVIEADEQSETVVLPMIVANMVCDDSQVDTNASTPSTCNVQRNKTPKNTPAKVPEQLEIAAAEEMEASENVIEVDEQPEAVVSSFNVANMVCDDSQVDTNASTPSTRNVQRNKTPKNTPAKVPEQLEIATAEEMETSKNAIEVDEQPEAVVSSFNVANMVCDDGQVDTNASTPSTRKAQRNMTPKNTPAKVPEQLDIAAAEEMEASENAIEVDEQPETVVLPMTVANIVCDDSQVDTNASTPSTRKAQRNMTPKNTPPKTPQQLEIATAEEIEASEKVNEIDEQLSSALGRNETPNKRTSVHHIGSPFTVNKRIVEDEVMLKVNIGTSETNEVETVQNTPMVSDNVSTAILVENPEIVPAENSEEIPPNSPQAAQIEADGQSEAIDQPMADEDMEIDSTSADVNVSIPIAQKTARTPKTRTFTSFNRISTPYPDDNTIKIAKAMSDANVGTPKKGKTVENLPTNVPEKLSEKMSAATPAGTPKRTSTKIAEEVSSKSPTESDAQPKIVDQSISEENMEANNTQIDENTSKSNARKSVKIITPKSDRRNSSFSRIGTPYLNNDSAERAEHRRECRRTNELRKLQEVFHQLVDKRVSLDAAVNESTEKLKELKSELPSFKAKPLVPARNNWAQNGLVDSETEDDEKNDHEELAESEDEEVFDEEDTDDEENEFVDDQAESAGEGYESGDSLDEEEREEIRLNEIHDAGENIGSSSEGDDSDSDEDNESLDSFIVSDTEKMSDEGEESDASSINVALPKRSKFSRKKSVSMLDSDDESDATDDESDATDDESDATDDESDATDIPTVIATKDALAVDKNARSDEKRDVLEEMEIDEDIEMKSTECDKIDAEKPLKTKSTNEVEELQGNVEIAQSQKANENELSDVKPKDIETKDTEQKEPTEQNEEEKTINVGELPADLQNKNKADIAPNSSLRKTTSKSNRYTLPGIRSLAGNAQQNIPRKSFGDTSENTLPLNAADIPQLPAMPTTSSAIVANNDEKELANKVATETNSAKKLTKEENNNEGSQLVKVEPKESVNLATDNLSDEDEEMGEAATAAPQTDAKPSKKKTKAKVTFVESEMEPEPIRVRRPVKTASGVFMEEPVTPKKKNRFGFLETPLTPIRKDFSILPNGQQVKRKSITVINEPSLTLPKPKWLDSEMVSCGSAKRRKVCTESIQSILKPSNKPRPIKSAKSLVPKELFEFRMQNLYRKGIPRRDAADLIRQQKRGQY